MASNNQDIEIKVKVNTDDVDKAFDDVEKSAKDMSKSIVRETDKAEKEMNTFKKSITNVSKEISNTFKNLNVSSLSNSLTKMKQVVANTATQIKKELKEALDVDGKIKIDVDTTSQQANSMASTVLAGATASAGATGAMMQKNLSIMGSLKEAGTKFGDTIRNSVKSFTGLGGTMKETSNSMKEVATSVDKSANSIKDMANEMKNMEAERLKMEDGWRKYREALQESGGDVGKLRTELNHVVGATIKCASSFEKTAKAGNLDNLLKQYQKLLKMLNLGEQDIKEFVGAYNTLKKAVMLKQGDMSSLVTEDEVRIAKELSNTLLQQIQSYKFGIAGLDSKIDDFLNRGLIDRNQVAKDIQAINKLEQALANAKDSAGAEGLLREWQQLSQAIVNSTGQSIPSLQRMEQLLDSIKKKNANSGTDGALISLSDIQEFLSCSSQIKKEYAEINKAQDALGDGADKALDKINKEMEDLGRNAKQAKKASTSIKEIGKASQQASSKVSKLGTGFKGLIKSILPMVSLYAIFDTLRTSISDAMGAIETSSKFTSVLGSDAKELESWINQLNSELGTGTTKMKDYTATMYSMTRNMVGNSEEAKQMTKDLVLLSQDMASFYNLDSEEAFNKLRSYMAGSSEVLYDYGVIATEANLAQFALAQGCSKTYNEMSQAEKASIRYQFAMQGLSQASGDLARTLNSPANQVRIFRNSLYELRVALGSCFTPILSIVLPCINAMIQALTRAVSAVANFINAIARLFGFGGSSSSGGGASSGGGGGIVGGISDLADTVGGVADGIDDASGGSGGLAKNLGDSAKSAKDMAESINKSLMGIDQINNLDSPDSSSSGGSDGGSGSGSGGGVGSGGIGSGGVGGGGLGDLFGNGDSGNNGSNEEDEIPKWLERMARIFKSAFDRTFNYKMFEDFLNNCKRIKQAITDIFSNNDLQIATNALNMTLVAELGAIVGTIGTFLFSIGNAIVGGIANSLEKNKQYIIEKLIGIANIEREASVIRQRLFEALSEIFSTLGGEEAQTIVENIFDTLIVGLLEGQELFSKLGRDVTQLFAQAIIDNKDKIKEAMTNALSFGADITGTLSTFFQDAFKKVNEVYDDHIKPFVDSASQSLSELFGTILDGYNTYMKPALDSIAQKFEEVMNGNVGDCVEHFLDAIGSVFDCLGELWNSYLKPIVQWLIEVLYPVFAGFVDIVGTAFLNAVDVIAGVIDGIILFLDGLITFITGVFSGDLDKAMDGIGKIWEGIVKVVKSIWDNIYNNTMEIFKKIWEYIGKIVKQIVDSTVNYFKTMYDKVKDNFNKMKDSCSSIIDAIKTVISNVWNKIKAIFTSTLDAIKSKVSTIFNNIKSTITTIINNVKSTITNVWNNIKSTFSTILENIKSKVSTVFNNIKSTISTVVNNIKSTISTWINNIKTYFTNGFNACKSTVTTIFDNIKSKITTVINNVKTTISTVINNIKTSFKNGFNAVKTTVTTVFDSVKTKITTAINGAKDVVKGAIEKIKGFLNFKWEFPKLKLPHFSISGSANPLKWIEEGVPKINVSWYRRGYVMPSGSNMIFGMNSKGLMGGGESSTGGEAVLPLNTLFREMNAMFDKQNQALSNNNNQPITLVMNVGGKKIAQQTFKDLKELTKRGVFEWDFL